MHSTNKPRTPTRFFTTKRILSLLWDFLPFLLFAHGCIRFHNHPLRPFFLALSTVFNFLLAFCWGYDYHRFLRGDYRGV